jgi:hypothetical protein
LETFVVFLLVNNFSAQPLLETGLTNPYRCFIIFRETPCWEIGKAKTGTAKRQRKLIGENSKDYDGIIRRLSKKCEPGLRGEKWPWLTHIQNLLILIRNPI